MRMRFSRILITLFCFTFLSKTAQTQIDTIYSKFDFAFSVNIKVLSDGISIYSVNHPTNENIKIDRFDFATNTLTTIYNYTSNPLPNYYKLLKDGIRDGLYFRASVADSLIDALNNPYHSILLHAGNGFLIDTILRVNIPGYYQQYFSKFEIKTEGNKAYFSIFNQLYKTDYTRAGTQILYATDTIDNFISSFRYINNKMYFSTFSYSTYKGNLFSTENSNLNFIDSSNSIIAIYAYKEKPFYIKTSYTQFDYKEEIYKLGNNQVPYIVYSSNGGDFAPRITFNYGTYDSLLLFASINSKFYAFNLERDTLIFLSKFNSQTSTWLPQVFYSPYGGSAGEVVNKKLFFMGHDSVVVNIPSYNKNLFSINLKNHSHVNHKIGKFIRNYFGLYDIMANMGFCNDYYISGYQNDSLKTRGAFSFNENGGEFREFSLIPNFIEDTIYRSGIPKNFVQNMDKIYFSYISNGLSGNKKYNIGEFILCKPKPQPYIPGPQIEHPAIYPNPNNGTFNIDFPDAWIGKEYELKMYDMLGKIVFSYRAMLQKQTTTVQTNLALGTYIVELNSNGENEFYQKLIILNKQ